MRLNILGREYERKRERETSQVRVLVEHVRDMLNLLLMPHQLTDLIRVVSALRVGRYTGLHEQTRRGHDE